MKDKPLVLEAGGSGHLFSRENGVNFEKEHCVALRLLKCDDHDLRAKLPLSSECRSSKKIINVQSNRV
jgi:hypothetical protein